MSSLFDTVFFRRHHTCPWWICWSFDNPLRRLFQNPERLLEPYVSGGDTAIDIGAGMGFFTLPLARRVGPGGLVYAVDLQPRMLKKIERRAERAGFGNRIRLHRADEHRLGITDRADFVLLFWMVHEVLDLPSFCREVTTLLKPSARLLVAEPRVHVTRSTFDMTVREFEHAGLKLLDRPQIPLSHGALFGPEATKERQG